ncbi:hypothetical protein [Halobacterium zhouii]|uniref:hypothetical protein n=1 Tax=Halobacterium zhouii TaxID=2902624 RepID=UPI001E4D992A|nr:hypothetical protein [Halobacterium zhouii]
MPTRRAALRAGSAALLAVLAGCQAVGDGSPKTGGPTTSEPAGTTTPDEPTLYATVVDASEVPDGSVVVPATLELHALVADAAAAEGRVDLQENWGVSGDEPLALGQFAYLRFRGETYEPNATYTHFAQEASYTYTAEQIPESEVGGDVLQYADLNESERAIVDEMLVNGSYDVGFHEALPAAARTFQLQSYLRVQNETYRVQAVVGDAAAHYTLDMDAASPGDDAQVVTVADRAPGASFGDTFTAAVEDGSTAVASPNELAAYLDGVSGSGATGVSEDRRSSGCSESSIRNSSSDERSESDGVDYVVTTTAVARVELAGVV